MGTARGKLPSLCGGPSEPNLAQLPRGIVQLRVVGRRCEGLGRVWTASNDLDSGDVDANMLEYKRVPQ